MSLRRRLILIAIAACYAMIFGEVFTRIFAPEPLLPRNVTGSSWGVRQNIPNATYRQSTRDDTVSVAINSQGMRADIDYAMTPQAGTCRIAITGDSFFFGYESERDKSIAGLLDGEFRKRGFRTETLNFAVSGFGNAETLVQFERRIVDFSPDITIFQFHATDLNDNLRSGLFALGEDGELVQTRDEYLPGVAVSDMLMKFPPYRWADAHSQFFSALRQSATTLVKRTLVIMRSDTVATDEDEPEGGENRFSDAQRKLTRALLLRTRESTLGANSDWYLFEVPRQRTAEEFVSKLDALELPNQHAHQIISPIQAFMGRDDLYQPNGHHHFTPVGNAISAQVLANRIVQESGERLSQCRI